MKIHADQIYTINDVAEVALYYKNFSIKDYNKVTRCRNYLENILKQPNQIHYGINTGFGALSQKIIPSKDLKQLQINLVRSHCTGVGAPLSAEVTRAAMFLRLICLLKGHSGVRAEVIELIQAFLNHNIIPYVPARGSVGASGDLAPLAHIALCLIGEGRVTFENKLQDTMPVLKKLKLKPLSLEAKEGLALINGTSVLTALGTLALHQINILFEWSNIIAALTIDAMQGSIKPFHEKIHSLKPHPGQVLVAQKISSLLKGSKILTNHATCNRVQDPYSLRCIPQVHGGIYQTLKHATDVLEIEINAVTDNPLIFEKDNLIVSGGNFHGEAASFAMDYLAMGLAELANISERRIEKMMNPAFSQLPAFLTKNSGLNSGLMIAQVTAAALASENKIFAHPATIDNVPTSTDKEDHVSMGLTSGLKLQQVLENTRHVLAIELLCATQCLDLLRPLKTSKSLEAVYQKVRTIVRPLEQDRVLSEDINNLSNLLKAPF
jgi:histidine ammonia-lyase